MLDYDFLDELCELDETNDSWDDGQDDGGKSAWDDNGDAGETDMQEAAMRFWNSSILEADASDFIKPTKTGTDETNVKIGSENDNYVGNPENDKGADDLMEDDDSTTELEMESFLF